MKRPNSGNQASDTFIQDFQFTELVAVAESGALIFCVHEHDKIRRIISRFKTIQNKHNKMKIYIRNRDNFYA